ncbi:hypothetical protein E0K89_006090 [Aquicoccus sp. SCR17]|nr:hypothetical protein [Carideicomes alvinocaridis]
MAEFAEERESLLRITFAPLTWALHFVLCYGTVSLACIKGLIPLPYTRAGLIAATGLALALIALIGWRAFVQWDVRRTGDFTNPEGHAEHRHQFLGHAGFLLAIISAIGVIYTGLPLFILASCK